MTDRPLDGVSATALAVARVRAHESSRGDRLFDDPYAVAFASAAPPVEGGGVSAERAAVRRALAFHVVIRTRFYDDFLLAATAAGCRQVVLLGAGLDTRAFRLDWPPGTGLWEVDLPPVGRFKDEVLAIRDAKPRCDRVFVAADLRTDWPAPLVDAGFDPRAPTAWLAEGLLVYLAADDAAHVLDAVTGASAPGSRLALERGAADPSLAERDPSNEVTSLWQGGLAGDVVAWLADRGWAAVGHDLAEVAAAYGRPTQGSTRSGFVTATRR